MKKTFLLFASCIAFGSASYAQVNAATTQQIAVTIPQVSMIGIVGTSLKTLTYVAPLTVGDNMLDVTIAPINLQYSSMMTTSSVVDRSIYVSTPTVVAATMKGLSLTVTAVAPTSANNFGDTGASGGTVNVLTPGTGVTSASAGTSSPKVITGITSGFTGTAATDGAALTFATSIKSPANGGTISSADYATLRAGTTTLAVVFTLSDTL
jgi:hypothetical protein